MTKAKLMKAVMLGLCVSAFSSNIAFAQMTTAVEGTAAVISEEQTEADKALAAKQQEIDQYVFTDHAKEIEEKGIFISYTAVVEGAVEIGITPFTEENANYFYDIFGKDEIRVVEFDQSVIFQTTVAEPADSDAAPDKEEIYTTLMDQDAATDDTSAEAGEDKVYKDETVEIQIESVEETGDAEAQDAAGDDVIYYTTAEAEQAATDAQTVSATSDDVKRGSEESSEGPSAPMTILAVAAGAAVIGGAVIVSGKKKKAK